MIIDFKKMSAAVLAGFVISFPFMAVAAGLVPCGGGTDEPACDFNQLMIMANKIVHFLLYSVAVPLSAIGFMWAGGNLVFSQNKEKAWSDAQERFGDIGKGFFIILGAFVLIKFILYQFLDTTAGFTLFLIQ